MAAAARARLEGGDALVYHTGEAKTNALMSINSLILPLLFHIAIAETPPPSVKEENTSLAGAERENRRNIP